LIAATVLAAPAAYALAIPPPPTQPVTDYAHVLSADAVARLNQQVLSWESGTTRKIVAVIFPSLEGEDPADFTVRLALQWKIGSKENDGVVVALYLAEHKIRIEVGYGLEGQLTDVQSKRIEDELMAPRFKQGDWEGGLLAGLAAIDTGFFLGGGGGGWSGGSGGWSSGGGGGGWSGGGGGSFGGGGATGSW
jgi:uncharacterized protein